MLINIQTEISVTPNGKTEICCSTERIKLFDDELLISVTSPSDTGLYVCNATNTQGSDAALAYLNVASKFNHCFIVCTAFFHV